MKESKWGKVWKYKYKSVSKAHLRSAVQVIHITLHCEKYWLHVENLHYQTTNKEGIQYYTLNFLWHFTWSILGGSWALFQKIKASMEWQSPPCCTEAQDRLSCCYCHCECGRGRRQTRVGELLHLSHTVCIQSHLLFSSSLTLIDHMILAKWLSFSDVSCLSLQNGDNKLTMTNKRINWNNARKHFWQLMGSLSCFQSPSTF